MLGHTSCNKLQCSINKYVFTSLPFRTSLAQRWHNLNPNLGSLFVCVEFKVLFATATSCDYDFRAPKSHTGTQSRIHAADIFPFRHGLAIVPSKDYIRVAKFKFRIHCTCNLALLVRIRYDTIVGRVTV